MEVKYLIFNTNIAIALKDSSCEYKVCELTIFEIESINIKFPILNIKICEGKEILIDVKCSLYGEDHFYHYNINKLLKRNMVIGGCEQSALPIFLIGKNQKVIEKVNDYKQTIEKIYALI